MKKPIAFMTLVVAVLLAEVVAFAVEIPTLPMPSFNYNGAKADLKTYKAVSEPEVNTADYVSCITTYTAPDGKLQVAINYKSYKKYPAAEYSICLLNASENEPTGIVSDFKSFDYSVPLSEEGKNITLNLVRGSTCSPADFSPVNFVLKPSEKKEFKTPSGRSSNDFLPFIEVNFNEKNGWILAIGWTGAWCAEFVNHGNKVSAKAGMDKTHFKLQPKESILQPSITGLQRKETSRREFKTVVHGFMRDNKSPRDKEGKVIPPIFAITAGGGNKTPKMMLDILKYSLDNKMPFDTYWIDAGWYGAPHEAEPYSNCGDQWAKYVGDWRVNTVTHPTGNLLPIADAVHKAGMKFLLWFEPERMENESPILQEHPEFRNRNLVDYGNPEALAWIQNVVYSMIDLHKIDVFREDFNTEPAAVWLDMDKANPDRVGIAEARHITGLYKFLDDMRVRFPGILQENCASGGRRIDIEMVSRAHSYCRSDYYIGIKPGDTAIILGQNATLNTTPYLPFQGGESNCVNVFDDYGMMSAVSSGTVFTPTDFNGAIVRRAFEDKETAWFKKVFKTAKRMNAFYLGDFYQLTEETGPGDDVWCGWQLDDKSKDAGFALVFRRVNAIEEARTFQLGNIDKEARYELEYFDGMTKTVSGTELATWNVKLAPRSFALIFYKKVK